VKSACLRPAPTLSHLPSMILVCGERKTIGRSPQADFVIDEPNLSRLHAAVAMSADGALAIEDLDSSNGVFVNGSRQKSSTLAIGDGVLFGILEYRVEATPEEDTSDFSDRTILRSIKVEEPIGGRHRGLRHSGSGIPDHPRHHRPGAVRLRAAAAHC